MGFKKRNSTALKAKTMKAGFLKHRNQLKNGEEDAMELREGLALTEDEQDWLEHNCLKTVNQLRQTIVELTRQINKFK